MMIDRLEPRLQFANLSGYVFNDADVSKTFDAGESPLSGTTVFIDANRNGAFDSGEKSTTADKTGFYQFTGLAKGSYTVGTTQSTTEFKSTTATADGTSKGRFDIQINGLDDVAPAIKSAFEYAKARWESVIVGDMPDVTTADGQKIDDLVIDAQIGAIDGVGKILGYADTTALRPASQGYIPYEGEMRFDSADLLSLQRTNQLNDVILHEMGHVLGVGTIWKAQGLLTGNRGRNPRFIGTNAVREFNKLFGTSNLSIPVENLGSEGTRYGHWRESVMTQELMTGYENSDINGDGVVDYTLPNGDPVLNPLSAITVGQFQDLGYQVNYAAADKWNTTTHEVTRTVGTDYGAIANERTITLGVHDNADDLNFGYATSSSPQIKSFSINPSPVAVGQNITLSATKIVDTDGDALLGVRFYQDTNGVAGLQTDSDLFIGLRTYTKGGAYKIQAGTTGLTGDQTYFAVATDTSGRVGRRTGTITVSSTTAPTEAPTNLSIRVRNASTVRVAFVDPNTDSTGYRIQVSTSRNFSDTASLVDVFNITGDTTGANVTGLKEGTTYYIRVRAFNFAGSGDYSSAIAFESI